MTHSFLIPLLLAAFGAAFLMPVDTDAGKPPPTTVLPCSDPRGCPDIIVFEDQLLNFSGIETQTFVDTDCEYQEGALRGVGERTLLRFTTALFNRGRGALHVGDPADYPDLFSFSNCHEHPHARVVDYRLWTEVGWADWQRVKRGAKESPADLLSIHPELVQQMVAGNKAGFCFADVEPYRHGKLVTDFEDPIWSTQVYSGCDVMGLSPDWSDVYYAGIPMQFIDVTGLASGTYRLEVDFNPAWLLEESNYRNNDASAEVTIP